MGVPHSLGNLAWGCQIWGGGGAKSPRPVTPVPALAYCALLNMGTGEILGDLPQGSADAPGGEGGGGV